MNEKRMFGLNVLITVADAVVCITCIVALYLTAVHFEKWWITMFGFIALSLYSQHKIILAIPKEGEEDG